MIWAWFRNPDRCNITITNYLDFEYATNFGNLIKGLENSFQHHEYVWRLSDTRPCGESCNIRKHDCCFRVWQLQWTLTRTIQYLFLAASGKKPSMDYPHRKEIDNKCNSCSTHKRENPLSSSLADSSTKNDEGLGFASHTPRALTTSEPAMVVSLRHHRPLPQAKRRPPHDILYMSVS